MPDIEFINKRGRNGYDSPTDTTYAPSPTMIYGLVGLDIKSHIQGESCKVVVNSATVALINTYNIAGWTLIGNRLKITGPNSITLNFFSAAEAIIGEERLRDCINGDFVV